MPSDSHPTKFRENERDSSGKKRKKHDDGHRKDRKRKEGKKGVRVIDDDADDDVWIEKNIDIDGNNPVTTDIPTAESLKLTSHASTPSEVPLPPSRPAEAKLKRDDWMLQPSSSGTSSSRTQGEPSSVTREEMDPSGDLDFFSTLGTERQKKTKEEKQERSEKTGLKELNAELLQGKSVDEYASTPANKPVPGGPGSQWRMMKLRRVYEAAEEEHKDVNDVALERYGTLEAFEEAKEERRILDERNKKGPDRKRARGSDRNDADASHGGRYGETQYMFSKLGGSEASSRSSSFRKPGGSASTTMPSTPSPAPQATRISGAPSQKRVDALRLPSDMSKSSSPIMIPTVMTPQGATKRRGLSPSSLNKLQAKVLKAKLMGLPDAQELEEKYAEEVAAASGATAEEVKGSRSQNMRVEMLPTMDGQGRLYDIGTGAGGEDKNAPPPGNRKKKEKLEIRDQKTGDILRYNADDDDITLGEMLRQEKFGGGMADQKNLDAELARAIVGDGKFENDLEYMDDNAEKLGRKKMRSDAMKRQFAINDYKKTQKVLATCQFCYGEDDSPPKAPVIAMATRCYLSCTLWQELTVGHCYIVPIQHHLTMLEGDDDLWTEVTNFMKCLMRMFAEQEKGVVFYETVINIRWQRHTFIECVPLPWDEFEAVPAYFKESILTSETEWSQHKKLIDFSARPGGFRRSMVANLPYFMVQFDHKGEKGYGHVIEGSSEARNEEDGGVDEGEKGGGDFPQYFAAEIIGNMLDLEPRRWRRPTRVDYRHNRERVKDFREKFDAFDWTKMI